MIHVILRVVVNPREGVKPLVVLWIRQAFLFRITSQGDLVALPQKPSGPFACWTLESTIQCNLRLPTNSSKDGVTTAPEDSDIKIDQTVVFHNDETVVVKEFPRYVSIGESFRDDAINSRIHDIRDFLGRPLLCASGTWSTTSPVGSQLVTANLPSACLSNASYSDKLRGFLGFRAKMVCRVQVNSQRFQQGRLLLHYLPQTATMSALRKSTALSSLVLITQQPRVDLNLNDDTEVRLEIPYVSNSLYYSMQDGQYDFGTFYLTVYGLLRTGSGATSCSYNVFCHFEDVEVSYPAVSQSGVKTGRGRGGRSAGRVDVSDLELRSEGLGPISSGLSRLSKAAHILSDIPMISSFAGPTSWMMGVLSGAADALGFSKPTNAGTSDRRTLNMFAYMNNTNAVDNSTKMALRTDNQVIQLPGFAGTDIDEMDMTHLLGIPCWISTFTWTTTNVVSDQLKYFVLQPAGQWVPQVVGSNTIYYPSIVTYLANPFQWYRGSLTLTFKFIKTEFHSGRVQVSFFPGRTATGANATLANSQYVFREIIDLRESSEVCITFPYTSLLPYQRMNEGYGIVAVHVLNPLVAPDAMSTTIDCCVELSAAADFEVAGPLPPGNAPVLFNPQSGAGSATSKPVDHTMDLSTINADIQPSAYCIGERLQSVRQMIKRFSTLYQVPAANTQNTLLIDPNANYIAGVGVTAGVTTVPQFHTDLVSYFANCYRFCRGSMRVKTFDPSAAAISAQVYLAANTLTSNPVVPQAGPQISGFLDQPVVMLPQFTGGGEFEMPYYNGTHVSHVRHSTGTLGSLIEAGDNKLRLIVTQSAAFSSSAKVYRAAGDDYSLGFFIGVVPLSNSAALVTTAT